MSHLSTAKRKTADALRRVIHGIEEAGSPGRPRLPLGVPEIDRVLPGGGLRLGSIHEVAGDEAATGFCAALLARAAKAGVSGGARGEAPGESCGGARKGSLLWLARGDDLYAPGLVRYGIGAGQLLVVSGLHRQEDMLWAMEEALRCRAVRGVVAETGRIGLAAGRRLMLAAEGTGVLGLVLSRGVPHGGARRRRGGAGVPVAVSRWRVTGEREGRWRVEVLHCRGGRPAEWTVGSRHRAGPDGRTNSGPLGVDDPGLSAKMGLKWRTTPRALPDAHRPACAPGSDGLQLSAQDLGPVR